MIACEVKQEATSEAVADTLAADAFVAGRALLVVLRPGTLVNFNKTAVVVRAEAQHDVVLRVTDGVRELLHEALMSGPAEIGKFCTSLPRAFGEALREIRADQTTLDTWVAVSSRWM